MIQEENELRQAKKLGLLGLAIALVTVFGVLARGHSSSTVNAQAVPPQQCNIVGAGAVSGAQVNCTIALIGAPTVVSVSGVPAGFTVNALGGCTTFTVTFGATSTITCTAGTISTLTIGYAVGAGGVSGTQLASAIFCSGGTAGCAGTSGNVTALAVCTGTSLPVTYGGGPTCTGLQPTSELKTCSNTLASSSATAVSTNTGQSFSVPIFSAGPVNCTVTLQRNGAACNLTTNPCADGTVVLSLTSAGQSAVITCGGASVNPGTTACTPQTSGTSLSIACGTTAGSGTTTSATCVSVNFNIQSIINSCINLPTSAGCTNLFGTTVNAAGASATVTITFLATPGNGGSTGGITLGTNTFSFVTPPIGLLLVTASPQAIPSNGTVASVVTATFACGTASANLVGGFFPLSSLGVNITTSTGVNTANSVNLPIIGTGQNAVCGAGLAGNFQFSTPGPVIFDNGRSSEGVSCGTNGLVSPYGNGASPFFGGLTGVVNPTFPLVFTCTGAAVLAIGAGVAGDAPVNVVYTSAIAGLQAVGSTLLTVIPSGIPRIAVSCNPSTIAAGAPGSVCTATVTDINGVPLAGLTGATVTWTTSDPNLTTILPCLVNVPGTLNVTAYPNVVPIIQPNTPCQVPTAQIPGQNTTFLNGQASAVLVASPTAHPETVTVTAALGVLIPPSFACLVSPYLPTGFGNVTSPYTATSGVGLPGATGCGFGNPVGFTGLATALSPTSNGLGIGGVILPNTTSAATTVNIGGPAGILIAGATPTAPIQLLRGCNQVIVTTTAGTPIANIVALVSPASAVVSVWRFANNTKQFQAGFFSDPNAPTDFATTGGANAAPSNVAAPAAGAPGTQVTETYFFCINQAATIVSG